MSRSKASAALERLKEFDKKYKLRGERKKSESSEGTSEVGVIRVSSAGSLIDEEPKELMVIPLNSKLDIRIPDAPALAKDSSPSKNSYTSKISTRSSSSLDSQEKNVNARKSESEISTHEDENVSNGSTSTAASSSEENNSRSYRSDTFEDATSSSIKSHASNSQRETLDASRPEKQLIELVRPKPVQSVSECELGLDDELSDYVKMMEALEEDSVEIGPITLLKSSVKYSEAASSEKRVKPKERKPTNSLEELYNNEKSIESGSNQALIVEAIDAPQEKTEDSNSTVTKNESILDPKLDKSTNNSEELQEVEAQESTDLLEENPEDDVNATRVLRQLNREAINAIIKRHRVTNKSNSPRKTSSIEEDNSRRSKSKRKQNSRSKRSTNSRVREDKLKTEKLDSNESVNAQRRRLIELRLQREREDLGAFRQELDNIHFLNSSHPVPKAPLIKPLELPNIESYQRSEGSDSPLLKPITDIERLGEKLAEIQYWLKDQYTLYREYSKLAQIMNARYVPSNLHDAKEVIRELKTRTSKITTRVK